MLMDYSTSVIRQASTMMDLYSFSCMAEKIRKPLKNQANNKCFKYAKIALNRESIGKHQRLSTDIKD